MKFFPRITMAAMFFLLASFVLTGCSQDEQSAVKSYNNSIVQIQKDMLSKAQDYSKVFEQPNLNPQQVAATLQQIQARIDSSHYQFRALSVPHGGEELSDAMEKFFQVEAEGIRDVIAGVQQLENKQNDPAASKAFTDTFTRFGDSENKALKDFYSTQQKVADRYGQSVVQTDQANQ